MNTPRVYLDTSVIGGCCDDEFAKWSQALLRDVRLGLLIAVISDLTERELEHAPPDVQDVHGELRDAGCQRISESPESLRLARKYVSEGIVPENYEADARHVAVATVHAVDVLVTWNFRHIVRYDKIGRFNAVNELMGYSSLQIHTPMEVASEEEV